jgi:1-deoxy-D-xylulose-5-phosphate synthase
MSQAPLLPGIRSPEDLRKLPREDVKRVAEELREEIIQRVSRTGGHLASSLGAVELLTALHAVFDTPRDRLVLDVGHQGYGHKMLTGRREAFDRIGREGGIAKFLRRAESPYDHFGAGHAGTSISAALGMARALQHQGSDHCAIALIGDGGMTCGMAFEALNQAGHLGQSNLVVVLNDNEMSISPNVGALSDFLSRKLSKPMVRAIKGWAKEFLESLPGDMLHWAHKAEDSVKAFFSPGLLFEALGFRYVGPIQGHRIDVLLETFDNVKQMIANGDGPILVHALTSKGYGYEPAQQDPFRYHGVGAFEVASGRFRPSKPGPPRYQDVFADTLIRLAREDDRIVGITAAMADGTGLDRFQQVFPDRFYDVGIAEQHAVTFAAGLATEGMKPVAAIYSTFLQRAYDQVVHDVCIQDLDVTFAMDRAGVVGADGATHQGFYDCAFLRTLPNIVVMAPKDENELQHMLRTAVEHPGPAAIRYPRGTGFGVPLDPEIKSVPLGEAELLRDGDDALVVALGTLAHPALEAANELASRGISVAVLNARFAKPLDAGRIVALARRCGAVVTVEEHSAAGGFGSAVLEALAQADLRVPTRCLGIPDRLIEHGDPARILASLGLDSAGIARAVRALIDTRQAAAPPAGSERSPD